MQNAQCLIEFLAQNGCSTNVSYIITPNSLILPYLGLWADCKLQVNCLWIQSSYSRVLTGFSSCVIGGNHPPPSFHHLDSIPLLCQQQGEGGIQFFFYICPPYPLTWLFLGEDWVEGFCSVTFDFNNEKWKIPYLWRLRPFPFLSLSPNKWTNPTTSQKLGWGCG